MRDAFSTLHPGVLMLYFAGVIVASMFIMHPVCLAISLLSATAYALYLGRRRALRFVLTAAVPMLVLFAVLNPVVNHAGDTVLATVLGAPLTLESIAYGLAAGGMFVSVITWFYCCNRVMASDAVLYLFGGIAPSLALLVTMVVRLVPHLGVRAHAIIRAQRGVGCDVGEGTVAERARRGLKVISILTSWALESSVDAADSMRSRGYGLPGRTRCAAYRFTVRDGVVASIIAIAEALVLAGSLAGATAVSYLPAIALPDAGAPEGFVYAVWGLLCLLPFALDCWEGLAWARSMSRA